MHGAGGDVRDGDVEWLEFHPEHVAESAHGSFAGGIYAVPCNGAVSYDAVVRLE